MIDNDISGKELAERSGLSESQISFIKNGAGNPTQATMLLVCTALQMPMSVVFETDYTTVKIKDNM